MKVRIKKPGMPQISAGALMHIGWLGPVCLAIAVAATTTAGMQAAQLLQAAKPSALASAKIVTQPLQKQEYLKIAEQLATLSNVVQVEQIGTGITVSVADAKYWPEMQYVLNSLATVDARTQWTISTLCMSKCDTQHGGKPAAHRATITGGRQVLERAA